MPRTPTEPPSVTIRQLREIAGLSLDEAVERLRIVSGVTITSTFLSKLELGQRGPSPEVLDGLARMYMVPIRAQHELREHPSRRGRRAAS